MLVARRRLLRQGLAVLDAGTLTLGLMLSYVIAGIAFHRQFTSFRLYIWLLGPIIIIWLLCLTAFGLYRSASYHSRNGVLCRLLEAEFLASLLLFSVMYLTRSEVISRLLLQTFVAVGFVLLAFQKLALSAYIRNARLRPNVQRRKVVLVADPDNADRCLRLMEAHASLLADVIHVLSPTAMDSHGLSFARMDTRLGNLDELPLIVQRQVVDEVIAVPPLERSVLERISGWCSVRGILLRIWLELPCPAVGHWAIEYFGENAFLVSLVTVPQNAVSLVLKRIIDVLGAAVGMVFCGVIYTCYGQRLRRESGDSPIFSQKRIGKNGRAFTLYKFRTMGTGAEQQKNAVNFRNEMHGPIFKIKNDPRVTSTGSKLRRRYLDELPQFWNVLRGEMSLVGTRPPTADETAAYGQHHHRRLSMKPGITGLWQLEGNGTINEFEQVVKLDCEYIDHWSLWLDARILGKTISKVLRGDGW
ncbi:MAG: sugar transferase [Deltaproteobacteria bacterium]|nr:sugar transferase [Deltaproteobacteria bacterium]